MPPRAKVRPRVALLIETSHRYGRDLLHGVHDWMSTHERWSIRLAEPGPTHPLTAWLRDWSGDGVIARVDSAGIAAALRRSRLPVVDVSAERRRSEFRRVNISNQAVAEMAVSHLLAKKLSNFAFCGEDRFLWSRERGKVFAQLLRGLHQASTHFSPSHPGHRGGELAKRKALIRWLMKLPKPIGIFASCDRRAREILEACLQARLAVPEEVAVLGVDDDELICEFCDPPLSSVRPNARRTGYEAAAILSRLMSGEAPSTAAVTEIEPVRVVERRSTDAIAVDDRHVAAALRYIREHACDGIGVPDVLRTVAVSRTFLERKFLRLLGHTPHHFIQRHKIDRVRELLAESDLAVAQIADMTGFESASYLSSAFRRETGESPRAYRGKHRPAGPTEPLFRH
jgi:LacI family transcriptional regulator